MNDNGGKNQMKRQHIDMTASHRRGRHRHKAENHARSKFFYNRFSN